MKIPQNQFLHSQSFNSEFVEFVWIFPKKESIEPCQFIFKFKIDGSVYFEVGQLGNDDSFYDDHSVYMELPSYTELNKPNFINFNEYFHEGKELATLGEEVVKYLNEI
jgi:hypothetical protein